MTLPSNGRLEHPVSSLSWVPLDDGQEATNTAAAAAAADVQMKRWRTPNTLWQMDPTCPVHTVSGHTVSERSVLFASK